MTKQAAAYFRSLEPRDRRAILLGAIAGVLILVYLVIGLPLAEDWSQVRDELDACQAKLHMIDGSTAGSKAKITGLCQTVPFVELPQVEDVQRKLFWDKTYDQLKSAGIAITSGPNYTPSPKKMTMQGFKTLRLDFSGTCKYEQFLKFLGNLKDNPYLSGIELLTLKSDEKKPDQVNIHMIVETFVK